MGKKKSRASQTSKGLGSNVGSWARKAVKRDVSDLVKLSRKQAAFNKGKNVMVTIPNPNKGETNKPFIRVNAKEVWRKSMPYQMKYSADG